MTTKNDFFVEKALLVDDCETDNFIHSSFILSNRFAEHIIVKKTGREALMYLRELDKNGETLPDVIFLDINMPIINGFQFLEEYENFPLSFKNKCKVVILSTSDNPKDLHLVSENLNVKDYIYKPLTSFELDRLKKTLSFYLKFQNS